MKVAGLRSEIGQERRGLKGPAIPRSRRFPSDSGMSPQIRIFSLGAVMGLMAIAPLNGDMAQAAVTRAFMTVNVRTIQDCSVLLSSSTTAIAASFACRADMITTTLSPTISSTSLATLTPSILSGGQSFGANSMNSAGGLGASGATNGGSAKTASGGVTQQFVGLNGSVGGGSTASQFIVSAAADDAQIVMITY